MDILSFVRRAVPVLGGRICVLAVVAATPGCFMYCPLYATSGCLEVSDLAQWGREGRQDRLLERLEDERSWVREEAAKALARHPTRAAVGPLLARVTDASEKRYVRAEAARALGRAGAKEAVGPLAAEVMRPGTAPDFDLAVLEALCALEPQADATKAALQTLSRNQDVLVSAAAEHRMAGGCGR